MVPFQLDGEPGFEVGDYVFVPGIRAAFDGDLSAIDAYIISAATGSVKRVQLYVADMTAEEREVVKAGCLINYNRAKAGL
jgi:aconitate hydratase